MYYVRTFLLITNLIFLSTAFILLCIIIVKTIKFSNNERRIRSMVYDLQFNLTNEKVNDFANIISTMDIPNRPVNWKTIRAGYHLIELDVNIDNEVKSKLKVILLSKGVYIY
ncbi:hypothetical protein [Alkaliphilus sp. B6464]|uniref:hypothetical protein n=1 Tax=Alkaliphilus sp. B6464 TaxID=2731219 RepID=UPI001BA77661|nr:hypothetical protein [Alkaliphilus sp. B6464]QUH21255.1 hypothetical protein HYG84_16110 [Alkaliphilus sp. B6464]